MMSKTLYTLLLLLAVCNTAWSRPASMISRRAILQNDELDKPTSCADARVKCNSRCSGIYTFDCSDSGRFTSGSYFCSCTPTTYASITTESSSGECFPGSAVVETPNGYVDVASLSIGDEVLTVDPSGKLDFNKVFMFTSYRPAHAGKFIRVATAAGANITLTPTHYIPALATGSGIKLDTTNPHAWPLVTSSKLMVGDMVLVAGHSYAARMQATQVVSVEEVESVGLFNPHTRAGAIVVDGVVASELTAFVPEWMAGPHFIWGMTSLLKTGFNIFPRWVDGVVAATMSKYVGRHGVADAFINRDVFVAAFSV